MAVRPVLIAPDPRLKQVSKPVEVVDDSIRTLMDDMLDSMYHANGIGLAAIQIGEPLRVLVIDLAGGDEDPNPLYFVNPEIYDTTEEQATYEEGCLSVPDQYASVKRPAQCRVKYLDYDGQPQDMHCEGLLATCLQHEMDHLEGVLFVDHLSSIKRNMILRKVQKAQRSRVA